MLLYSLFQHPFVTYAFVLSTALALVLGLSFRLIFRNGTWSSWLFVIPLVAPVLSYFTNYILLGKFCGLERNYLGGMAGFPSYHLFCLINNNIFFWVAPMSILWLVFSLSLYGWRWFRTRQSLKTLSVLEIDDPRPWMILSQLCHDIGVAVPALRVLDCSRPIMFTGGFLKKAIVLSSGTLSLMDDNELRAALAHEMAHIQRRGHLLNWFLVFARDLTMFSPASLWAYASFCQEEEKACDALAAAQTGLGVELASALVKMMKGNHNDALSRLLTCLLLPRDPGVRRVKHLLKGIPPEKKVTPLAITTMTVLLVIGSVFIC